MARQTTDRFKFNPQLGRLPVLQFIPPAELQVDHAYQRSLEGGESKVLIRKIAQHWNWDLCLPLVVSRRERGELYVIDGQHRLEAARLRGDVGQLPCVVVEYANAADEAASFVNLNQQRRPLSKLDLFKAAVASGDERAVAIVAAIEAAGLAVAPHGNFISWRPGMVSNIGGIEAAWAKYGADAASEALVILAGAWPDEVLRYAGTIFPGIAGVVSAEMADPGWGERRAQLVSLLGARSQLGWRTKILRARAEDANLNFARAAYEVVRAAWKAAGQTASAIAGSGPVAPMAVAANGRVWCAQCDRAVSHGEAGACRSPFCSVRKAA